MRDFDTECANVVSCTSSPPLLATKESHHMSTISDFCGTVFFVWCESGIVSHLPIPAGPDIIRLERIMRAAYDATAAAGGNSVRLQLTYTLDMALVEPGGGRNRHAVVAAAALGPLRLHGRESLAVLDHGDHYEYVPIADAEDHLANLRTFASPVARPVTPRRMH